MRPLIWTLVLAVMFLMFSGIALAGREQWRKTNQDFFSEQMNQLNADQARAEAYRALYQY